MSEIYPKISETEGNPNTFRLQKINEINSFFEKEIEDHRKIRKKYKKIYNVIHVLNTGSGISSITLSVSGLGLFIAGIFPPVAIAAEGVAIGVGVSMVVFDNINKILMHKIEKHTEIIGCAEGKLSTIHGIYSKALEDGKIDTEEFKLFLAEKDKYIDLKDNIRKKALETQNKINKEEIQKEFLEKGRQLGKNEIMEKLKGSA